MTRNGLPIPIDSFALRRTQDSLREVAQQQHYADSIAHLPPTDSTLRYIIGFHHVRIFSDSLQAVADSLYYSTKDSIFRLFYNPVAWGSGNYQITGDTMYMYTKNKKAERLYVFENAPCDQPGRPNALQSTERHDHKLLFPGRAKSIISAPKAMRKVSIMSQTIKRPIPAPTAPTGISSIWSLDPSSDSAGNIEVDSAGKPKGRELDRVVLRNDAEGTMTPMRKVIPEDMVLRGFKWQEKRRPKSKAEMFENAPHGK